eukprot:snap_masked-scaffold_14-processed-gene-3.36-mRNA-1 protein AED:1.00 eAED:1.00 QI:0/0/0/0/1/1/3/0/66
MDMFRNLTIYRLLEYNLPTTFQSSNQVVFLELTFVKKMQLGLVTLAHSNINFYLFGNDSELFLRDF